ncbi:HesB/IscA family protein [Legionella sp. CNM-4043-24]|uniref:HesB/IscA family protein n=1 Tax=Legionella sp. CNM-4043-24 TaxID=3421646 RepID=UPI00403B2394
MSVEQYVADKQTILTLTDDARNHLLKNLVEANDSAGVRLSVKKTGCSGLSYVVDYVQTPADNDIIIQLNDKYVVCIDKASYPFLKGMSIDYVRQGLNQKFVFTNPNQTGQCGCGESFTVSDMDPS